jgi:hypothetical protein
MNPLKLMTSFVYDSAKWAAAGFPCVSNEEFARRSAICLGCKQFNPTAYLSHGGCKLCHCDMKMKTIRATSGCDAGKWGAAE